MLEEYNPSSRNRNKVPTSFSTYPLIDTPLHLTDSETSFVLTVQDLVLSLETELDYVLDLMERTTRRENPITRSEGV